jgi:hypothetical protein
MTARRTVVAALVMGLLASLACSKTQDTTPERRFFGQPPVIESVNFDPPDGSQTEIVCDVTEQMFASICVQDGVTGVELFPDFINVRINYTEGRLDAVVTDPNTTEEEGSDILLVAASFVLGEEDSLEENTLVLFDDGSTNTFPFEQTGTRNMNCSFDTFGNCSCSIGATISSLLNSNDTTAEDGVFSRGMAFYSGSFNPNENSIVQYCIARDRHQSPKQQVAAGTPISFRIDAVDRSGNLATFPESRDITVQTTTFTCEGDLCACCIATASGGFDQCRGLEGLKFIGNPTGPGLCQSF